MKMLRCSSSSDKNAVLLHGDSLTPQDHGRLQVRKMDCGDLSNCELILVEQHKNAANCRLHEAPSNCPPSEKVNCSQPRLTEAATERGKKEHAQPS